jgi:hypothetical protein
MRRFWPIACVGLADKSGTSVKKASEYRQHARDCRALARKMESEADREQMLAMAAHWERLARDRAAFLSKHPELASNGEREEDAG